MTAVAVAASLIGVSAAEATMAFDASASHTIETATLASPTSPPLPPALASPVCPTPSS
ncbi:MAG: hypothetical protein M3P34_00590 [Actinomycetota bacterium]|nr:hypothetical protein [Actinomycetota bacterium]